MGAGLAGLNCARLLREAGWDPLVLEAAEQAGGRTRSVEADNLRINMGGIEIGDGYNRFLALALEYGVELVDPPKIPDTGAIYAGGKLIGDVNWLEFDGNPLPQDLRATLPARLQSSLHFKNFPLKSTSDWLNPVNLKFDVPESQRLRELGADDAILRLINRNGNFNDINQVSSLHVMRGLANYRFGGSTKTLRIKGGNDLLALNMALNMESIKYRHNVREIWRRQKNFQITCDNGAQFVAENVVLAIPFSVLRRMRLRADIPSPYGNAIRNLPYTRITKLVARVDQPFWEKDGISATMWCDAPLERTFLVTPEGSAPQLTIFINGAGTRAVDALSQNQAIDWILRELYRIRPSAKGAITPLAFHSWGNDSLARGAYAAFAPGQIGAFAKVLNRPIDYPGNGTMLFCGEHCAQSSSGMEGALESGEYAARRLLSA